MSDIQALEGVNKNYAFRTWEDLTRREQLLCMISDDYKSLYGFRPRGDYSHMSDDDLQEWHNEIRETLSWEMDRKRQDEREHSRRVSEAMTRQPWTLGDLDKL